MAITRGDIVEGVTAGGGTVRLVALGSPQRGRDFPVLWVCTEDEWSRAEQSGDEPQGLPWPVEDITELAPA